MPADHLFADDRRNVVEIELTGLVSHLGVKNDLKQQVAQLVAQRVHVVAGYGIGNFVGLFDRVRRDTGKVLFDVPWTAIVRVAELAHYFKYFLYLLHNSLI